MIPVIFAMLAFVLLLSLMFWGFIHYLVYRAFHFKHVFERRKPDPKEFPFNEVMIPTEGHKKIQLYDLNPQADKKVVVLAIHGWANTCEIFLPIARQLIGSVRFFMLNTRNHGRSDSEKLMNILKFEADILHAIDFVQSVVGKNKKLVVIGHSLGAAASILAAKDDKRIDGVVAISSFADVRQIMFEGFLQKRIPSWFISIVLKYIEWKIGRPYNAISPVHIIGHFNKPTLLVHGTQDELVPFRNMERIRAAASRENVEIYVADGHSHSSLLKDAKIGKAILRFLDKYFLKR